ncbi:hypothetical protein ACHAW5_008652 [Stephanodiscus triporus]|uniref:Uncharacterized protein n=1 Tax=Stephanodiscus triporus TaxID=2934178 RepID=A0ABD3MR06_9STRA
MAAGPAGSPPHPPGPYPTTGSDGGPPGPRSRRVVRDGSEVVAQRKIYGLYHRSDDGGNRGTDRSTSSNRVDLDREEGAEGRESRRDERRWKERLRRKFDVALGLQLPSQSSASTTGAYYNSWKTQMEGMDDGRKEELRRRMNELNDSPAAAASRRNGDLGRDAASSSSSHRNNRRARMRAKTTAFDQQSTLPRSIESPKSRLDEVPFWREGGSIASLLFENRPSSSPGAREDRHSTGKRTLEVRVST